MKITSFGNWTTDTNHPWNLVLSFHNAFNAPINYSEPTLDIPRADLRRDLIEEEYNEFIEAYNNKDIIEVSDALADLVYVIYGAALEFGIPLNAILDEVHASNMSKLDAYDRPILREDGKILKGPNYFKPNIKKILES